MAWGVVMFETKGQADLRTAATVGDISPRLSTHKNMQKRLKRPDFKGLVLSFIDADFCKYMLILNDEIYKIKIFQTSQSILKYIIIYFKNY